MIPGQIAIIPKLSNLNVPGIFEGKLPGGPETIEQIVF